MAEVREDGVWPSARAIEGDPSQALLWKPVCDLDGPNVPDPLDTPGLPIPFTANELAAFMLSGVGAYLPSLYGDFHDGPDERMLHSFGPLGIKAKEALVTAYAAYKQAERFAGRFDRTLEIRANELADMCDKENGEANSREGVFENGISTDEARERRKRASVSVAHLFESLDEVKRIASSTYAEWRKKMVNELLNPKLKDDSAIRTIVLPVGTQSIKVTDIPTLIAEVLHSQQLAAGALPDGAQELPDDSGERTRNVQLYRLARDESLKVKYAIGAGELVAFSKLTKSRCGIDDIENAYVKVDAFTAFVAQTYDGMHVRQADAQTQGITPSSVPVEAAGDGAAKRRRRTWRDVTEAYLERTFTELQCPTVKEFFAALMRKAGNGSPFDKGVGQNSGNLFARDVGAVVTLKMIEGFVTDLRKKM